MEIKVCEYCHKTFESIRIWDSTEQIKRELGFNNKHIQNVARGKGQTAYGYRWEYL